MGMIKSRFVCYLLLIFVYINSGYALNTTDINFSYSILIVLTGVLLVIATKNTVQKEKFMISINASTFFFYFLTIIVASSYFVHFGYESGKTIITLILLLVTAYLFCNNIDFDIFIDCFIRSLCFLSIISIIAFLMQNILIKYLPSITNTNTITYYIGGVFFYIKGVGRVMSIFWEPGIFACYLCFAMSLLIIYRNSDKKYFFVFVLALILTQSTTGFALCVLVLLLRYFHTSKNIDIKIIIIFILTAVVFMYWDVIVEWLIRINRDMFIKLSTLQHSSTGTRLFSFRLNYMLFKENPLFGQGFAQSTARYRELQESTYALYRVGGQTSTSGQFLSALGISGSMYTIAWIYGIIKNTTLKKMDKVVVCMITLIVINVEPNTLFSMSYIIMFYFLKNVKLNNINN